MSNKTLEIYNEQRFDVIYRDAHEQRHENADKCIGIHASKCTRTNACIGIKVNALRATLAPPAKSKMQQKRGQVLLIAFRLQGLLQK